RSRLVGVGLELADEVEAAGGGAVGEQLDVVAARLWKAACDLGSHAVRDLAVARLAPGKRARAGAAAHFIRRQKEPVLRILEAHLQTALHVDLRAIRRQ